MAFLPTLVDMLVEILAGGCRLVKVGRIEALEISSAEALSMKPKATASARNFNDFIINKQYCDS